ncbi:MAG: amidohydrolase family protein [Treponema sp.]|jgi:predicted TIM-barrel fold metal-dependent hydrolase|nr:amidohydrolase family protein [Treponema sp.]
MIVDFHTHIWPDSLAKKAITELSKNLQDGYEHFSDGTASGLIQKMDEWNIDKSIVLPVQTKASQSKTINEYAFSINQNEKYKDRIISFGGIWPYTENIKEDIDFIVAHNFKGIKFHPEYQRFNVDDKRFFPLYEYALSKGLILIFHAGVDITVKDYLHSSPKQFKHLAEEMKGGIIVAAHLGGHLQTDEAIEVLAGSSVYIDTSMGFGFYGKENFLKMVAAHGAEKILFASDSPWGNAKEELENILSLPLAEEEKNLILSGNAIRLLEG